MPNVDTPAVTGLSDKISTLERRAAHLETRVADHSRKSNSRAFDRAEASALRAAIECMRFVQRKRSSS